jgi:predicted HAD superfamily Cof-like phosphohydrolase
MNVCIADVYAFNQACNVPMRDTPGLVPQAELELAIRLIDEEVNKELLPTLRNAPQDLVTVADAAIDSIYVITGLLLRLGIPGHLVWQIVQRTNMAKVDPDTGEVVRRADGKILKPEGWQPPEPAIKLLLEQKGWKP